MAKLLLDTWALLEILAKGPRFHKVKAAIAGKELYTTTANLYEAWYRLEEENGAEKADEGARIISMETMVLAIEARVALRAAKLRKKLKAINKDLGAIDIITYAAADAIGATLLTGDPDFKGVSGVIQF